MSRMCLLALSSLRYAPTNGSDMTVSKDEKKKPTKRKPDSAKEVELEEDAWEKFEKAVSEVVPPKKKD